MRSGGTFIMDFHRFASEAPGDRGVPYQAAPQLYICSEQQNKRCDALPLPE